MTAASPIERRICAAFAFPLPIVEAFRMYSAAAAQ